MCYNGSVFFGSDDSSVLLFEPTLPQSQDVAFKSTTTIAKQNTKQRRILRVQKEPGSTFDIPQVLVSVSIVLVLIILAVCGYMLLITKSKKGISKAKSTTKIQNPDCSVTTTDLKTVVNSVMGISKHAAYIIENSALAKVKKIALGGGGELFLSNVMDPSLRKKHGEMVAQKIVFVKSKTSEEAFYQEVGIMIMLSTFPKFCQIIGFTENPLSMILKTYPDGSLYEWIRKNTLTKRLSV